MENKINIIIVDDHQLMRQGLIAMLEKTAHFEICGEASNGKELLDMVEKTKPDIVILDLQMPVLNGYAVLPILKKDHPAIKVIVLTEHDGDNLTRHLFVNGAQAHLLKNCEHADLVVCIEKVYAGIYTADDSLQVNKKLSIRSSYVTRVRFPELSLREIEVLKEFCSGKTHSEIAESLVITVQTVKFHFQNIHAKTGIKSPAELVKFALLQGITRLDKC